MIRLSVIRQHRGDTDGGEDNGCHPIAFFTVRFDPSGNVEPRGLAASVCKSLYRLTPVYSL